MESCSRKSIFIFSGIFFLGLLFRLFYLHEYSSSPVFYTDTGADVYDYSSWAKDILSGHILWKEPKIHSPLYAYLLAGFYYVFSIRYFWIRLVQELIGLLIAVPVIISLFKAGIEKRMILLTALIWCWYPPLIYYSGEFTCELLLMLMLSLSIMFIYIYEQQPAGSMNNAGTGFICSGGFCLGLANITHPISLIFTVFETLYLLFAFFRNRSVSLLAVIIFAGSALVPVVAVVSYNSLISGELFPVQRNSGFNFWLGNNENSTGTCYIRPGSEWEAVHEQALANLEKTKQNPEQFFYHKSFAFIKEHPVKWIKLLIKKMFMTLNYMEYTSGPDLHPVKYFTLFQRSQFWAFGIIISLALSFLAVSVINLKRLSQYRHFILLFFSYLGALTITVTSGRYRIPIIIAVIPLASAYLSILIPPGRHPSMKNIALLSCFAIIVFFPVHTPNMIKEDAESLSLYGEACLATGDFRKAADFIKKSISEYPDIALAAHYNMLGAANTSIGNMDEAIKNFSTVLDIQKKGKATAYSNIANIYDQAGDMEKARQYYQKAFEDLSDNSDKELSEIYYNYAVFIGKTNSTLAEHYYIMSIDAMPFNVKALNNLAVLYLNNNSPGRAIPLLKRAVQLSPDNRNYRLNLSIAEKK